MSNQSKTSHAENSQIEITSLYQNDDHSSQPDVYDRLANSEPESFSEDSGSQSSGMMIKGIGIIVMLAVALFAGVTQFSSADEAQADIQTEPVVHKLDTIDTYLNPDELEVIRQSLQKVNTPLIHFQYMYGLLRSLSPEYTLIDGTPLHDFPAAERCISGEKTCYLFDTEYVYEWQVDGFALKRNFLIARSKTSTDVTEIVKHSKNEWERMLKPYVKDTELMQSGFELIDKVKMIYDKKIETGPAPKSMMYHETSRYTLRCTIREHPNKCSLAIEFTPKK